MMNPGEFTDRQIELNGEFGKWLFEHPDMLDLVPDGAYVFFEVAGEPEFNEHSRKLATKHRQQGTRIFWVRVKGLAPPQGSRLIDPVIEPVAEAV